MNTPIGTVKGPGPTAQHFLFVTDDNERTKVGEFVYYPATIEGTKREIIGKITHRQLIRNLPDHLLSNPKISPQAIAELIGLEGAISELYQVEVTINGFFQGGAFINPRIPPSPGAPIYLVPSDTLTQILNPRRKEMPGSAHLGSLLSRPKGEVPIVLDVKNLVSTHLAILAGTGSGKSYTAGVLVEEFLRPYNRAAILIIDPHGEYHTLKALENHPSFIEGDYRPQIKIFQPEKIKVRVSTLTFHDLAYLLPNLSDKMLYLLKIAYNKVTGPNDFWEKEGIPRQWGIQDLLNSLDIAGLDSGYSENEEDSYKSSRDGLRWRLQSAIKDSEVFHDVDHLALDQLFKPGQCSVLQLNDIDQRDQQVIVSTILRRINKARMDTEKGKVESPNEYFIPYPVFVLLEEAHRYAPAKADVSTTAILKTILSEGRKFGVGIGLITQRPGKLDGDVLSQCMTQMILRIVNPVDQQSISAGVEGAGRDLLDELPALSRGQAIVSGVSINTPVLCQVRDRLSLHGGETIDAPSRWLAYFGDRAQSERAIEEAMPVALPHEAQWEDGFPT